MKSYFKMIFVSVTDDGIVVCTKLDIYVECNLCNPTPKFSNIL
jgi:hypothetical protein